MTLDEFDALKIGDVVQNGHGHNAEVVSVTNARSGKPQTVGIRWSANSPVFWLFRDGTLWFGLEVVQPPSEHFDAYGSDEDGKHA